MWLIVAFLVLLGAAVIARLITTAVKHGTHKRCPACAELVKSQAAKCKHCGESLG